jgi:predicted O-methyltransferase YrrM
VRLLERLIRASPERPTRLHDLRGRLIDRASWPLIPVAIADTTALVAFGYRRQAPWISYRATRDLSQLIKPDWRILEFGAGMSTPWLATRAASVLSVESDSDWYSRVQAVLARRRLTNVRLLYRSGDCDAYASLSGIERASIDFALIDGDCRDHCVVSSMEKMKPGGYIYLDNTDQPGDRLRAEQALLAAPLEWHRYYNDFAPGLVAITQGLLAKLAS